MQKLSSFSCFENLCEIICSHKGSLLSLASCYFTLSQFNLSHWWNSYQILLHWSLSGRATQLNLQSSYQLLSSFSGIYSGVLILTNTFIPFGTNTFIITLSRVESFIERITNLGYTLVTVYKITRYMVLWMNVYVYLAIWYPSCVETRRALCVKFS